VNEPSRKVVFFGIKATIPDMPEFAPVYAGWLFSLGDTHVQLYPKVSGNDAWLAQHRRRIAVAADVACRYWERESEEVDGTTISGHRRKANAWAAIAERARRAAK
jgi:hypothetical protein